MKKIFRVISPVLCLALFFASLPLGGLPASAEFIPPETVTYSPEEFTKVTDTNELTGDVSVFSRCTKTTFGWNTPSVVNGSALGFGNENVLKFGLDYNAADANDSRYNATVITPRGYQDAENGLTYPVSEISGRIRLTAGGSIQNNRGAGPVLYTSRVRTASGNVVTDLYYGNTFNMAIAPGNGLRLWLTPISSSVIQTGSGDSAEVTMAGSTSTSNSHAVYSVGATVAGTAGKTYDLKNVISDEANRETMAAELKALTSLSEDDMVASYRIYYEGGVSNAFCVDLTLNIGGKTYPLTFTTEDMVFTTAAKASTVHKAPGVGSCYYAVTSTAGHISVSNYTSAMTVKYDLSSYHALLLDEEVKELIRAIDALPDPDKVTLADEQAIRSVAAIYESMETSQKLNVSNSGRLAAILSALGDLISGGGLDADAKITFEPGQPGIQYFESPGAVSAGGWGTVANPKMAGLNTSDTVLSITRNYTPDPSIEGDDNRTAYRLKSGMVSGNRQLSNITGKVYLTTGSTATLIYDYASEESWQGVQLAVNSAGSVTARCYKRVQGAKMATQGSTAALIMETENSSVSSGVWVDFNLEYTLTSCRLSVKAPDQNGRPVIGTFYGYAMTLLDTNYTRFAVATGGTAQCYFDDFKVNYQDTQDYTDASAFKKEHKYILNLIPAETYISDLDRSYVKALEDDYAALGDGILQHIPFMDVKVENVRRALDALDASEGAAGKAAADKALLDAARAVPENYTAHVFTDDFSDGIRAWQPARGIHNTGSVSTEYNADFGSTVLKMAGTSTITLKDILLPEKPQVAQVSYRVKLGEAPTDFNRLRFYYNYIDDTAYNGYSFYQNPENGECNYRTPYPGMQGAAPVKCYLNMNNIWRVTFTFSATGVCLAQITDEATDITLTLSGKSALLYSKLSLTSFGKITYIDDLSVTYRKGNYDVDQSSDDVVVYYTSNVWLNPGDVALLSGDNLAANIAAIEIAPLSDGTTVANKGFINKVYFDYDGVHNGEFSSGPVAASWDAGKAQTVSILQKTDSSVKFLIPQTSGDGTPFPSGVYSVKITASDGAVTYLYLNAPSIDFTVGTDGATTEPGGDVRVVGKNLSPELDPGNMHAVLVDSKGKSREVPVSEVQSIYSVSVTIPSDIDVSRGDVSYELWLYSGRGDNTAWAIPVPITVAASVRSKWPTREYNIRDYGATGSSDQNATPCFINALAAIDANGGGVLYLPDGAYSLDAAIVIPQNCVIRGQSSQRTAIIFRPFKWAYDELPDQVIVFEKNIEISHLSIQASRIGGLMRGYGDSSDNVYINDVRVSVQPYAGSVTEGVSQLYPGLGGLLELSGLVRSEQTNPIFALTRQGDNVQITDFDGEKLLGSNRVFFNDINGSQYWQVRDSILKGGWSECIISSSIWENTLHGPEVCVGVWGHGLYFANNKLFDRTFNNRELYVADRGPNYTGLLEPVSQDADNVEFRIPGVTIAASITQHAQIYVRDGQGAGQTRTVIGGRTVTNPDKTRSTIVTVDRPFTVMPNRNSQVVIRRPRENIFFVNNEYENGAAGGFYGGFADVVYDGNTFNGVGNIYQQARTGDVNWYLSVVNDKLIWREELGDMGSARVNVGHSFDARSGKNSQRGFVVRGCEFDGQYTSLFPGSTDSLIDLIYDRNEWKNVDYALAFNTGSRSDYIDGVLFYQNSYINVEALFEPGMASLAYGAMAATNQAGYKRMIMMDGNEVSTGIMGDVNGDGKVSIKDCTMIKYAVVELVSLTPAQMAQADVNGDTVVDLKDAMLIRLYILEIIPVL